MISDTNVSRQADEIVQRLKSLRRARPNGPKDLPENQPNATRTDPLYPVDGQGPARQIWDPARMITGSGNGPAL